MGTVDPLILGLFVLGIIDLLFFIFFGLSCLMIQKKETKIKKNRSTSGTRGTSAGPQTNVETKGIRGPKGPKGPLKKKSNKNPYKIKNKIETKVKFISNERIYALGLKLGGNNTITRNLQKTCHDLLSFDETVPINNKSLKLPNGLCICCYGCAKLTKKTHPVYLYSCHTCGDKFQKFRHFSRDLTGLTCLVTGGRTKLGHQIVMKLIKANAKVIITTRKPSQALALYEQYPDWDEWKERLYIYPNSLDFDKNDLKMPFTLLVEWIETKFGCLDVLINCAAQTIRVREKNLKPKQPNHNVKSEQQEEDIVSIPTNRYQDSKFVHHEDTNSWSLKLSEIPQYELEEVLRINATAPFMLIQAMHSLMEKSSFNPYIINVHAKEGLFNVKKSQFHIHTNMAKASLCMLTKCLLPCRWKTEIGKPFYIHGCDPGWFSVDEYYEATRPYVQPPLDEIDGAARILFPLFKELPSCGSTRRHFEMITY